MQKAEVLIAGLGGQGVQLAGDILARSCTLGGRNVSVLPSYGAEARGTLIRSEVVISEEDIIYPGVLEPDLFVAFSQEAYDHFLPELQRGTVVLYDSASVTPSRADSSPRRQCAVPAIDIATSLGNAKAANVVMLGALAALSDLISRSALENTVSKGPEARRERSINALGRGFEIASQECEV